MRIEKQYLLLDLAEKLRSTPYVYLVNFATLTVAETVELRRVLGEQDAHFHVVKNAFLRRVAEEFSWPSLDEFLVGQTAVVFGGNNPSGVMKTLSSFSKNKGKLESKGGILDSRLLTVADLVQLAQLPDIHTLRATLLSLLVSPARGVLSVANAASVGFLNVLKERERHLS
jgi:large subunit ribosomal protein L10